MARATGGEQVLEPVIAGITVDVVNLIGEPVAAPLANELGLAQHRQPLAHPLTAA